MNSSTRILSESGLNWNAKSDNRDTHRERQGYRRQNGLVGDSSMLNEGTGQFIRQSTAR